MSITRRNEAKLWQDQGYKTGHVSHCNSVLGACKIWDYSVERKLSYLELRAELRKAAPEKAPTSTMSSRKWRSHHPLRNPAVVVEGLTFKKWQRGQTFVFRVSALHESSVDLDSLGRTDCIQSEPCALSPRSPERFLLHLPGWPLATICVCRRIRHSDSCGQPFNNVSRHYRNPWAGCVLYWIFDG